MKLYVIKFKYAFAILPNFYEVMEI